MLYLPPFNLCRLTALCFASLLAACAHLPQTPLGDAQNQAMSLEQRQTKLRKLNSWTVAGAMAVKNDKQGGQLRFHWQQQFDRYDIDLTAPLSGLIASIQGNDLGVTVTKPNQPPVHGRSAEAVVEKELGWSFPVDYLKYWVRGLPAPQTEANTTFDAYNHLQTLQQAGWVVEFSRYTYKLGNDLPAKIIVTRPPLVIRTVISRWQ